MDLKESVVLGFRQLLSNKGRTFLTMLGMFIGVGAVIMILALGEGFKEYTKGFYSDIGLGAFQITTKAEGDHLLLTPEDFEIIKSMPEIQSIMGALFENGQIYNKQGETKRVLLFGSEADYTQTVEKLKILAGRSYTEKDNQIAAKVIMVPDIFAKLIFRQTNYKNIIGKTVEITFENQTQSFEIIGVYKSNIPSNANQNFLENALSQYPLYTAISTLTLIQESTGNVANAYGSVKDGYDQKEVTNQVRLLLNRRHQQKDSYNVSTAVDMIDMANNMLNMITLFISAVAGISLLVGGVGIMNIMLVTVKERTREIGVRKALGAENKVILRQFLIEALILTVIAGTIGMLLGYVGSIMVGSMYNIQSKLTIGMILFAVGTSTAIGLLFGVYPAYQAARLDPVDSLRCE
ncbi:MAG: FtsX-like permease family protein [Clostridia bacterium]|jgi:putative ABC transport system permease protein|nr:FtsX-like permease family protein [Clostridia bacterium]